MNTALVLIWAFLVCSCFSSLSTSPALAVEPQASALTADALR